MGERYIFSICYMDGGAYRTHKEEAAFSSQERAYQHFRKLLSDFKVGGQSYYLCNWSRQRSKNDESL